MWKKGRKKEGKERDKGEMSEERVERAKQGDGVRRWGREKTDRATGRRKLRTGLEEQNTEVGSLHRSRKEQLSLLEGWRAPNRREVEQGLKA